MYRLSFIVVLLFGSLCLQAQSPHGEDLTLDCIACHTTEGWEIDDSFWESNEDQVSQGDGEGVPKFDHSDTEFPLEGTHQQVSCNLCHASLVFDEADTDCVSCHLDVHQMTFGNDCVRCHDAENWLVDIIPEIHEQNGFPLAGVHAEVSCVECHVDESQLRFQNTGNECVNCHLDDYNATTNPNHQASGFSLDCAECHTTVIDGWRTENDHDALYFPIYSGSHAGVWSDCVDCHIEPNDFSIFSCINCHFKSETDDEHDDVPGYVYEDNACLVCHPTGEEGDGFDHSSTNFPLTGAHINVDCISCHIDGYAGTSTECVDCHKSDFDNTSNPNHLDAGIGMNCIDCHTTDPGWKPASFDIHDEFYPLLGAHADIANDCAKCHMGSYQNTPNECIDCHRDDYNDADDPDHQAAGFPEDCTQCHNLDDWEPAEFDHDFPIYSGNHKYKDAWNQCVECHIDNDYDNFSCIDCHEHNDPNELADDHEDVNDYSYNSNACYQCHPDGNE